MKKFEKFAEESSIHGLKYIFTGKYSKFTRIFFCCSVLLTFVALSLYIYSAFFKFMIVPETVTRSSDLNPEDFPAPAITLCSNLFAREGFANLYSNHQKYNKNPNFTISELECKYFIANLHWCLSGDREMIQMICKKYDLKDFNVLEFIDKSALQTDQLLYNCLDGYCNDTIVRVFTENGICFTYNMQGFNTIFNTEVIHNDFIYHQKEEYSNGSDTLWTPEKGYPANESDFPVRATRGQYVFFQPILSTVDQENSCAIDTFRVYFHKPNEIVTPYHQSTSLKYDDVS